MGCGVHQWCTRYLCRRLLYQSVITDSQGVCLQQLAAFHVPCDCNISYLLLDSWLGHQIMKLALLQFTASVSSLDLQFKGMTSVIHDTDLFVRVLWSFQNMCLNIHLKDRPPSLMQHGCYELSVFALKHRPMMFGFWILLQRELTAWTLLLLYEMEQIYIGATTTTVSFRQVGRIAWGIEFQWSLSRMCGLFSPVTSVIYFIVVWTHLYLEAQWLDAQFFTDCFVIRFRGAVFIW